MITSRPALTTPRSLRPRLRLSLLMLAMLMCGSASAGSCAFAASPSIHVFPSPGAHFAAPQTQITFRGIPVSQLGSVTVAGSRSGPHTGRMVADSDGQGGSFVPATAFAAGETVTVITHVPIVGGNGDSFQFLTATPAPFGASPSIPMAPRVHGDVLGFQSRPDLHPASVKVVKSSTDAAAGDVFLGPQNGPIQNGPMLLDPSGRLIWFKPSPRNTFVTDFRAQMLGGSPVLTYWQGVINAGTGNGVDLIDDSTYHQIYSVRAGNGLNADLHEFQLTPQGTALMSAYYPVYADGRSIGRSSRTPVLDAVVQEIDIKTGLVLFQWDSLDHVPLTDSYAKYPSRAKLPFDYFHINSIQQASDGNLVISSRHTWSGYKIDHGTGAIIWILGGKRSSFKMGSGAQFAWQHDIRMVSPQLVTVFDDGAGDTVTHHESRGLVLMLDLVHHTATRVREYDHAPSLLAFYEGNTQTLPSGNVMIGWGQQPYFTEFDSRGRLVFDGRFLDANSSYRAYRFPWSAAPGSRPALVVHTKGTRSAVYVSWNGATNVSSWRILGGSSSSRLSTRQTVADREFETRVPLGTQGYFAAQALDSKGHVLGQSLTLRAP